MTSGFRPQYLRNMKLLAMLLFLSPFHVILLMALPLIAAEVSRKGHRSFADSLVPLLYNTDNECTSTWGVSLMLDLARPGGTDITRMELCDVVSLCDDLSAPSVELLWTDTIARLVATHDGSCLSEFTDVDGNLVCDLNTPTLQVANSVWIDINRELNPAYSAVVGELLQQTDFNAPGAGAVVNDWVNDTTNGLIDSILAEGPIRFDLLAINSIYLNAQWAITFSEGFTNEDTFYTGPTRDTPLSAPANFMHKVDFYQYSQDAIPGYQVIQLPYVNNILSMVVVLPTAVGAPRVTAEQVADVVPSKLNSTRIALALPKFTYESKYDETLKMGLQSLGVVAPFDPAQGFCSLFQGSCQFLDVIIQKTVIDVNEFGTEAAAVTLGAFPTSAPPPTTPILFLADYPFQFFIYDQDEDLVIFEGQVGAPTIPSDARVAQLQAVHNDADFWMTTFGVDPTVPSVTTVGPTPQPTPTTGGSPPPTPSLEPTPMMTPTTMPPSQTTTPEPTPSSVAMASNQLWLAALANCLLLFL